LKWIHAYKIISNFTQTALGKNMHNSLLLRWIFREVLQHSIEVKINKIYVESLRYSLARNAAKKFILSNR